MSKSKWVIYRLRVDGTTDLVAPSWVNGRWTPEPGHYVITLPLPDGVSITLTEGVILENMPELRNSEGSTDAP